MAKRTKRAQKGIESLRKEIENHFDKIEQDIKEKNLEGGRYHFKEIEKSLLVALETKLNILNKDFDILEDCRKRLQNLKDKLELNV